MEQIYIRRILENSEEIVRTLQLDPSIADDYETVAITITGDDRYPRFQLKQRDLERLYLDGAVVAAGGRVSLNLTPGSTAQLELISLAGIN